MFLLNSRHPLVCAPPAWLPRRMACLSRSYAGNLPSSFSTLRSSALVFSTSPPVSVSGTVYAGVISWDTFAARGNPISPDNLQHPSLTRWPTNVNVVPIDYGFRPRLRGRLTLRRLALRRNPWTFGDRVFHTVCRYSCQHSHFPYLHQPSRVRLHQLRERSATACTCVHTQSFGAWLEPRYIFGARTLDQ